jgi:hypothetical protein
MTAQQPPGAGPNNSIGSDPPITLELAYRPVRCWSKTAVDGDFGPAVPEFVIVQDRLDVLHTVASRLGLEHPRYAPARCSGCRSTDHQWSHHSGASRHADGDPCLEVLQGFLLSTRMNLRVEQRWTAALTGVNPFSSPASFDTSDAFAVAEAMAGGCPDRHPTGDVSAHTQPGQCLGCNSWLPRPARN